MFKHLISSALAFSTILGSGILMSPIAKANPRLPSVSAQPSRIAQRVNPSNPCPHGGRVAGANCKIYAFKNPVIAVPGVKYWVSVEYAGVYYKPEDKLCPYGGGRVGANCKLVALDGLLTKGIEYWVDTTIQYPGVYYRQSK